MAKRKFGDDVRMQWIELRKQGYSYPQIAKKTGAAVPTLQKFFCSIGMTYLIHKDTEKTKNNDRDDTPEFLIKINNLYLEPDAAIRYLELRAKLGLAGMHWEVLDSMQGYEKELELSRYRIIEKVDINKDDNSDIKI